MIRDWTKDYYKNAVAATAAAMTITMFIPLMITPARL